MVKRKAPSRPPVFPSGPKPPPNYFSRSVQLRMMVLVFAFMAVLMLMTKARDPDTWSWMWALDGTQTERPREPGDAATPPVVDSRPAARPEQSLSQGPMIGMDRGPTAEAALDVDQLPESLQAAQLDGWDSVLQSLDDSQQMLLRVVLWNSRHAVELEERQQVQWDNVLSRLDERWRDYHSRALLLVATDQGQLSTDQKRICLEVLELSKRMWADQRDALAAAAAPQEITVGQREQLTQLQATLDQRALNLVEDNTVLRGAETEAWFRLWELLQGAEPQSELPPTATYLQLFSQPGEYRGRLIRVSGQARMAYQARAAQNPFGIEGYYVFAVRPQQGGDNPLIVYCLDVPAGFPEIKNRDADRQTTMLREDMEFTGYLFKRWVYPSRGGPNLAPLLVARVSDWKPRARLAVKPEPLPKFGTMVMAVVALAVLATAFTWRVYRRSQWKTSAVVSPLAKGDKVAFDTGQVRPGVKQSLQALTEKPPVVDGPGEDQ